MTLKKITKNTICCFISYDDATSETVTESSHVGSGPGVL